MIYYISDIHFSDQRVFDKCNKPFEDLDDYKNEIIKRWNNKVSQNDTVYVLGDISDGVDKNSITIFNKLNGTKHLIVGNHDEPILEEIVESRAFESVQFIKLIDDGNRKVCLCHYPLMDWMEFSRDGYHVYGHVHNKTNLNNHAYVEIKKYYKNKRAFNASVDVTNYEPVTLDEMISLKEVNVNEPYIN